MSNSSGFVRKHLDEISNSEASRKLSYGYLCERQSRIEILDGITEAKKAEENRRNKRFVIKADYSNESNRFFCCLMEK